MNHDPDLALAACHLLEAQNSHLLTLGVSKDAGDIAERVKRNRLDIEFLGEAYFLLEQMEDGESPPLRTAPDEVLSLISD